MSRLDRLLIRGKMRSLLIGQLHDSLSADAPPEEVERVKELMQQVMVDEAQARFTWLRVPLGIDLTVGRTMAGNPLGGGED
jgi:DNA polymerase I-like protein with 3'-5' exonuclease and polymerase domains